MAVTAKARRRHAHLRQRRDRHRDVRPDAEGSRRSPPTSTRDPAAALERVPSARSSCSPGRSSWSALPIPAGTSPSRSPQDHPTILCGPDRGQIPVAHRESRARVLLPDPALHGSARPDPPDPDRPQDDGRGAVPRRALCCASSAQTLPVAASNAAKSRVTGVSGGQPVLDDGGSWRSPTSSGAPASSRSSTGSGCRSSATTAGQSSSVESSPKRQDCSSAVSASSTPSAR